MKKGIVTAVVILLLLSFGLYYYRYFIYEDSDIVVDDAIDVVQEQVANDMHPSWDQDGDGLFTWQEYPHNTCPTNANTDGDQYDDGVEVNAGADPLRDDSQTYGAMQAHPASFNLYTSNSVLDLSYGEMMVQMVSNNIQVRLTMQSTDMLDGDGWTNVGPAVEWETPADLNKCFFRFLGAPAD